ncbi:MAG: hypothetical protein V1886_02375 [archaeon]
MTRELKDIQKDWNLRVNASHKKDVLKKHNNRITARQKKIEASHL